MQHRILAIGKRGQSLLVNVLRFAFYFLLLAIVVPNGSASSVPFNILASGFLVLSVLAALVAPVDPALRRAHGAALALALPLALWIVLQSIPFEGNPFANPIWTDASGIYGAMPGAISIAPGDTLQGLLVALLPFAIFMTGLNLFGGDRAAFNLIKAIVLPGVVICLVGILQFLLSPEMLLFEKKRFYLESLTAVFINRNTASTYIAMILLFTVGMAFHYVQNAGVRSLLRYAAGGRSDTTLRDAVVVIFYATAAATVFVALMLSRSRAGVASGMVGMMVMIGILAYHGRRHMSQRRHGFSVRRTPMWVRIARTVGVVAVVLAVGGLFAGQVLLRAGIQGTNDLRFCFYPTLIQMIGDHWAIGTGFSTFRDAFPAYRNPACGMAGALTRAHSFYFEGMITLGVLFAVVGSLALAGLFYYLIRGIRERRQFRWIAAAGFGTLILQILHNGIDFSLQNPGIAAVFAALMAAAVSIATGRSTKARSQPPQTLSEPPAIGTMPSTRDDRSDGSGLATA